MQDRTGIGINARIGRRNVTAGAIVDDRSLACSGFKIVALGIQLAGGIDRIAHVEIYDIIIEAVEVTVAHQTGRTGDGVVVIVITEGDTGLAVVGVVGLLRIGRIAHENAVFVMSERAVGNGRIVGRALEIQEFIPVI